LLEVCWTFAGSCKHPITFAVCRHWPSVAVTAGCKYRKLGKSKIGVNGTNNLLQKSHAFARKSCQEWIPT